MSAQKNMAPTGCLTQFPVACKIFISFFPFLKFFFGVFRARPLRQLLHKHRGEDVL
jgi:hypothetical protein